MTTAKIGHGTEFHLDNASGTLTELGEVLSVGLPNPQVAEIEATHYKSPDRRREYIAGLIEDGEGSFEFNYVPGNDTDVLVREAISAGTARSYKIVLPAASGEWEVSGECIVKGWERNVPIDDRMTATLTVRFTGAVTEAAAA